LEAVAAAAAAAATNSAAMSSIGSGWHNTLTGSSTADLETTKISREKHCIVLCQYGPHVLDCFHEMIKGCYIAFGRGQWQQHLPPSQWLFRYGSVCLRTVGSEIHKDDVIFMECHITMC